MAQSKLSLDNKYSLQAWMGSCFTFFLRIGLCRMDLELKYFFFHILLEMALFWRSARAGILCPGPICLYFRNPSPIPTCTEIREKTGPFSINYGSIINYGFIHTTSILKKLLKITNKLLKYYFCLIFACPRNTCPHICSQLPLYRGTCEQI